MAELARSLVASVYVEGRRVQFWEVEFDPSTGEARLGYELVGMPDQHSRERLGEVWYCFEDARAHVHPELWELACERLAALRKGDG